MLQNDYPITTNAQQIGQLAWTILHQHDCEKGDGVDTKICGQVFSNGGWNVILREVSQEDCDASMDGKLASLGW